MRSLVTRIDLATERSTDCQRLCYIGCKKRSDSGVPVLASERLGRGASASPSITVILGSAACGTHTMPLPCANGSRGGRSCWRGASKCSDGLTGLNMNDELTKEQKESAQPREEFVLAVHVPHTVLLALLES